jgi:hypothetical protein
VIVWRGAVLLGRCDGLCIIEVLSQDNLSVMCKRAGPLNWVLCKGQIEGEIERVIVGRSQREALVLQLDNYWIDSGKTRARRSVT